MYYCYLLINDLKNKSYVGKTNNIERRIKQHNGILNGGAKATKGNTWTIVCYIINFASNRDVLQFEWQWKYITRKSKGKTIFEKRLNALVYIDNMGKTTSNSIEFKNYDKKLDLIINDNDFNDLIKQNNLIFKNFNIITKI
jgi:putative endonuclease